MADTSVPIGNEGRTNGATPVTMLSAPAASTQRVVPRNGINFYNADSASVTVTYQKNKGGTITILKTAIIATLVYDSYPGVIVLDATNESLEIVLAGAVATVQPYWDVSALETT